MRLARSAARFAWLLLLALMPAIAARSATDEAPEDTIGWHVVQEGESLQTITARYLGTSDLWFANLKLNPQLRNPSLLRPGQRIRVILDRQVPARRARIEKVANEVDKNVQRAGW